jgi:phenylpyruvate tautomerase PptA (4-oxalocrotonate tautomerase family)
MNVSEKNENTFGLVLNEIAKSVLCTLNKSEHEKAVRIILGENDPTSIFVMGRILVGISDQESDRKIASGVAEILITSALPLAESRIKVIVAEVRAKCTNQVLALQRAYTDIENGSSAEEALAGIKELL